MEKKLLHGVYRTHGRGVTEKVIQQDVKSKKKQDKVREEVKVVVMKGDATYPDYIACILYDTNIVHIISNVYENFIWTPIKNKF